MLTLTNYNPNRHRRRSSNVDVGRPPKRRKTSHRTLFIPEIACDVLGQLALNDAASLVDAMCTCHAWAAAGRYVLWHGPPYDALVRLPVPRRPLYAPAVRRLALPLIPPLLLLAVLGSVGGAGTSTSTTAATANSVGGGVVGTKAAAANAEQQQQ
jgi:hypothetical protein